MSELVIVSKLPEKLPWNEGTIDQVMAGDADYFVADGTPQYGSPVRLRDNTGESFFTYTHNADKGA